MARRARLWNNPAMAGPFIAYGAAHIGAVALAFTVPLALAALVRRAGRLDPFVRWTLVAVMIGNQLVWLALVDADDWVSWQNLLPMHLCDWAQIAAAVSLIWPRRKPFELAYFWAFGGTLQALLTPELAAGFPDIRFIIFFVAHGAVITSVLYLLLTHGLRPTLASLPRVAAWSLFYMVSALSIDMVLGTNFGYLRFKPDTPSLLDYMAPWPWYLAELIAVGAISLAVYYSPFLIADLWRASRQRRSMP
jgi:hypothetical integral membrane protein (TIGR02206 family)